MKAFSLAQPWAYEITHLGKRIENRTEWKPNNPGRRMRGKVYLHASKTVTRGYREDYEDLLWRGGHVPGFIRRKDLLAIPDYDKLPRGGIVGVMDLIDTIERDWYAGGFAFVLAKKVTKLPFLACNGMLGFFQIEDLAEHALAPFVAGMTHVKITRGQAEGQVHKVTSIIMQRESCVQGPWQYQLEGVDGVFPVGYAEPIASHVDAERWHHDRDSVDAAPLGSGSANASNG